MAPGPSLPAPIPTPPVIPAWAAPAAPGPAPVAEPAQPDPEPGPEAGRTILVIEDDERFAGILGDLAREMGFGCLAAHTATDGLALAAQRRPDAIVLDINPVSYTHLDVYKRQAS